jgi:hypothetical protein
MVHTFGSRRRAPFEGLGATLCSGGFATDRGLNAVVPLPGTGTAAEPTDGGRASDGGGRKIVVSCPGTGMIRGGAPGEAPGSGRMIEREVGRSSRPQLHLLIHSSES